MQLGTAPSMPRICRRQTMRANVPADSPLEYFRKAVTFPLLDELAGQFATRFSKHQQVAASGLSLLPPSFRQSPEDSVTAVLNFARQHRHDLPEGQNMSTLEAELARWQTVVSQLEESKVPTSLNDALLFAVNGLFPSITRLLQLLATWPVTSNSCERSISGLRRLKTYLRSTTSQVRLCGLALLHTHYSMQLESEVIIRRFLELRPRAIIAPDMFHEPEANPELSASDSESG